jgi:hypothetical protein
MGFWTLFMVWYCKEHNVSETETVSFLGRKGGYLLLCSARYKDLALIAGLNF